MLAKTEMEDLQNQLEQMTKSKVNFISSSVRLAITCKCLKLISATDRSLRVSVICGFN